MISQVLLVLVLTVVSITASRLTLEMYQHRSHHHRKKIQGDSTRLRILYQIGNQEEDLPVCSPRAVCSKVDLYESPWLERQCRCPNKKICLGSLVSDDGFTIADKTRQYKMCESVKKLPKCRYFRDVTWTLILTPNNATEQIVHCHCPRNSVTYLINRHAFHSVDGKTSYEYSFACSPQSVNYL
ncbi:hypothetical protein AMK59_1896 [Oryctes borbonicus]|uniref:Uncharacterized protein n=1 Tax=Oryctes borbonicus TaxID=1629725 RepID=A0A0T6BEQ6_9SCAR|nr:hypothetical protein AMK59_1896 [Oryctes borbonicus]